MVVWEWVALEWMGTCISKKMNPIWWRKRCSWCPCCISLHIEFSIMWCFGLYLPLSKHWICQCLDYNRPPFLDTNANPCMSLSQHLQPTTSFKSQFENTEIWKDRDDNTYNFEFESLNFSKKWELGVHFNEARQYWLILVM